MPIFDPAIFDPAIFDTGAPAGFVLEDVTQGVDHVLHAQRDQLRIVETLGGIATGSAVIWDPLSTYVFRKRDDIKITDGSDILFRGQIITRTYKPWAARGRYITLTISDYNTVFDERLVGVPDGGIWIGPDDQGNYTAVDPNATTGINDARSIQDLFSAYVQIGALTIDVTSFVNEYVPNSYLGPNPLYWDRVTLRQAVSDVDGLGSAFITTWLAPDSPLGDDLALHHVAIPDSIYASPGDDPLARLFPAPVTLPAAPIGFSETPDGVTTFAADFAPSATFDGTFVPEQVYETGATDFAYGIGEHLGRIAQGGTGTYQGQALERRFRQALISTDAKSADERDAYALRALERGARETVRGELDYTDLSGSLVFHPGMGLRLQYLVSMELDTILAIQRVDTTFLTGSGARHFHIEWGDAPVGRITARQNRQQAKQQKAAGQVVVKVQKVVASAGEQILVDGQYTNELGEPWAIPGKVVNFSLEVFDSAAVLVCSDSPTNPGQPTCSGIASVSPTSTTTDILGRWTTTATSPTVAGYTAYVIAAIPVT